LLLVYIYNWLDPVCVAADFYDFILGKQDLSIAKTMADWDLPVAAPSPQRLARHANLACHFGSRKVQHSLDF